MIKIVIIQMVINMIMMMIMMMIMKVIVIVMTFTSGSLFTFRTFAHGDIVQLQLQTMVGFRHLEIFSMGFGHLEIYI